MAISSISQITLPNGSTYALKDAGLHTQTGVLSGDGTNVIGVSESYFRPTVKIFDAAPTRTDLSVIKISAEDYADLVADDALLSDVLYVVEGSYEDVYGQQVKNMAPGTDLSDAVNLEQLTEVSSRAYATYTQTEVDQKIASAQYFKKYVVESLPPLTAADDRGIYLVPSTDSELSNVYDEYVTVGEGAQKAWEKIGAKNIDLSGYKTKQTAKTSPTASGTATAFIDTISQDENGVITATKKNVQAASTTQAGIVQLNNTLTSTSTAQAATANAVKSLNDKFADYSLTSHTHNSYVPTTRKINGTQLTGDVNVGTVTGITMNGASKGTSGVVNLGTVLTAHQSLTGYYTKADLTGTNGVLKDYSLTSHTHSQYLTTVPSAYKTYADTKSSLSSDGYATQAQLDTKSSISVDTDFAPGFKFEHISLEDYISKSISGIVDGNTLYDISSENMTVFDQKIVDLAPGEDPTDAPNMSQLTEVSARACDTYTQDEVDQKIADAEAGYKLVNATGVLSSGSYVYEVQDKAMTTIGINQSSTPVVVVLPSAGNGARDFILRIEISSTSAPTFTFTNTSGLEFESEDDDWAVMQPGVNLVSFTETKR